MSGENQQTSEVLRNKRITYALSGLMSVALFGSIGYVEMQNGALVEGIVSYALAATLGATGIAGYRENLPKNQP